MDEFHVSEFSYLLKFLCSQTSPGLAKRDSHVEATTFRGHCLHTIHLSRVSEKYELYEALLTLLLLKVEEMIFPGARVFYVDEFPCCVKGFTLVPGVFHLLSRWHEDLGY